MCGKRGVRSCPIATILSEVVGDLSFCSHVFNMAWREWFSGSGSLYYTRLFEMIVGVLTTCHIL
jgi:hypothetical protein